ncbi:MAG: CHAT domain-containing protein [Caldilineaceae bacterium]|nr:CHAT domain-containing protein [Caldilineaceae bacterium]
MNPRFRQPTFRDNPLVSFDAHTGAGYNGRVMMMEWVFDLLLELTEDGYRATVHKSPAGTATVAFMLPLHRRDQHAVIQQLLGDAAGADEQQRNAQFTLARDIGGKLFGAVFHGPVLDLWRESWQAAYAARAGLRVQLGIGDDSALRALPWEYLYDDTREEFLALSVHTPVVRYVPAAHKIRPLVVTPPLRVLVVMAGPEGYPPLAIGRDWRALVDTVDYLAANGRMTFERLAKPTLLDLQRRLRQQPYHILHFVGFAVHDAQTQAGVLVFEDEMGRGRAINGDHLGRLLSDHYSLRLAIVEVRNAARVGGVDPAADVAEQLVRRGAPAAIYQPSRLRTRPSLAFLHAFYDALAAFRPVDVAMTEARRAIQLEESGASWGLPHLVSRITDGQLFEHYTPPPPAPKPRLYLRSVLTKK